MDTPQSRLRSFIEENFRNLTEYAELLGVTPGTLNSYLNGSRVYTTKTSLARLAETGINVDWYLHGIGEPKNANVNINERKLFNEHQDDAQEEAKALKDELYRVPKEYQGIISRIRLHIMSVNAATGTLTDLDDMQTTYMPLALGMNIDEDSHDAIYVNGDSMKDAGVTSGDIIIFEVCKNKPTYDCTIVGSLNGMPIIKHLINQKDGSIILKSDSEGVKDILIGDLEDLHIFGIVKKVIKDYAPIGKKN